MTDRFKYASQIKIKKEMKEGTNMKKMKKMMALVIAVVMMMAMTMTTMAAGDTYTITINNSVNGYVYEAYKIFGADLKDDTLSNIEWGNGVNSTDFLAALKADTTYGSKFTTCTTAAQVAKVLEENKSATFNEWFATVVANELGTVAGASTYDAVNSEYEISELTAGYYFVKNTTVPGDGAYTKYVLKIVKDTEVTPKSSIPSATKKVNEKDTQDYNIGDDVPFTFTTKVPDMTHYSEFKMVFEDTLDAGFTFWNGDSNNLTVKIGTKVLISNTDYTVTKVGNGFNLSITNLKAITGINEDDQIVVSYTAKLNESAKLGDEVGNKNTMVFKFSNNPNNAASLGQATADEVIVYTYELDVLKVKKDTAEVLSGAQFVLYRNDGVNNEYVSVDANSVVSGWSTTKPAIATFISGGDGKFVVKGLDAGTYYLEEIKAPDGYNLLDAPVEVIIASVTADSWETGNSTEGLTSLSVTAAGNAGTANEAKGTLEVSIGNQAGSLLPETGGIGTTIFYAAGAIMVVGAVVVLVTRKRMENQ